MKKTFLILNLTVFIIGFFGIASATTFQWQPTPADLWDLDHHKYYEWGIKWSLPADEIIDSASLFFDDIRNWDRNPNDLWVTLLNYASPGAREGYDHQGGGNYFSGKGTLLNHWQNLPTRAQDITYQFTSAQLDTLTSYLADNNFGLGFDPDCHYYNNGITLTINTKPNAVPEPGAMLLLGFGLAGLDAGSPCRARCSNASWNARAPRSSASSRNYATTAPQSSTCAKRTATVTPPAPRSNCRASGFPRPNWKRCSSRITCWSRPSPDCSPKRWRR